MDLIIDTRHASLRSPTKGSYESNSPYDASDREDLSASTMVSRSARKLPPVPLVATRIALPASVKVNFNR